MTHVQELMGLYEAQAGERGVELVLVRQAPYISLVADVTMFRQIFMNLLSNAVKFTENGRVEVELSEADGDFILKVRDTGIGVDPKYHGLIFDKFYRVRQGEAGPARQGSGLGLAIVKGLVEAQGGSVSVASMLGKGAQFTVRLPRQPGSSFLLGKQGPARENREGA
jgi:signal transduction histidine kinase